MFFGRRDARSPEVLLWDVTAPSGVFQSKVVVHRLAEFLLASEIAFGCLNRGVPKQKLNLLQFSARQMAEPCAGAA